MKSRKALPVILLLAATLFLLPVGIVSSASSPTVTYTNTPQTVTQTQWRSYGGDSVPFGTTNTYDDSGAYYTYNVTGNSLFSALDYEPAVTNQVGNGTTDTFNGASYTGTSFISYDYLGLTMYNVFQDNLSFNGAPISATNLVVTTGQENQWVLAVNSSAPFPNAQKINSQCWLIGFSVYTYGATPVPDTAYPGGSFWSLALNPSQLPSVCVPPTSGPPPTLVQGQVTWTTSDTHGFQYIYSASVAINGKQFSSIFYESIFAQYQLIPGMPYAGYYSGSFGAISGCQSGSNITITATINGVTKSASGLCPTVGATSGISLNF